MLVNVAAYVIPG